MTISLPKAGQGQCRIEKPDIAERSKGRSTRPSAEEMSIADM